MKNLCAIFFAIFASILVYSQKIDIHPIDSIYYACMSNPENYSTAGSLQCADIAYYEWFKEMESNLKLLQTVLSDYEYELLMEAQRNWYAFQNSETIFSDTMYVNMDGTMYQIFAADDKVKMVRQRALDLKEYYDTKLMK